MIIFGGWGTIVGFGGVGLIMWGSEALFGSGRVTAVFAVMAGLLLGVFGQLLHQYDTFEIVNRKTGLAEFRRNRHHLFFVSVRWWGLLIAVGGVATAVSG